MVSVSDLAKKLSGSPLNTQFLRPTTNRLRAWNLVPNQQIKQIARPSWRDCRDDVVCIFDINEESLLVFIGKLVHDQSFLEKIMELAQVSNPYDFRSNYSFFYPSFLGI